VSTFECEAIVSPLEEGDAELGGDVDDEDDGEEVRRGMAEEVRRAKRFQDPKMPSRDEIEDHEVAGHFPFRSWCVHSVRGKGHEERQDGLPDIHIDYAFIGSRSEKAEKEYSKLVLALIMKEKHTKMTMASVVPKKGSFGVFAAKSAMCFSREIGLDKTDIVMKSDQEAAAGSRTVVEFTSEESEK
jgi:hypothetical protein